MASIAAGAATVGSLGRKGIITAVVILLGLVVVYGVIMMIRSMKATTNAKAQVAIKNKVENTIKEDMAS